MNEVTVSTGEATGRMEANIGGFREITGQVLTDLGQLARSFDEHGQELAKAATLIESSNRSTEQSVNERRVQLESLVSTLDIRTDEIAERLKRFSGLIDQTLDAAANRARDVARVVSEATTESARTAEEVSRTVQETGTESARVIGEQFERVREQAEAERRRSMEAMHEIFERSSGETHALFEEANGRFAETLHGMKQMASEMQRELETAREDVQRELEATRAELRRGVLELPQETAESTAQMRRVIVDQIEALAELNRIVARHGRSLDAVEPMRGRGRDEAPLAIVGGRGETSSRSEPVRETMREPAPPSRPEPRTPPRDVASFAPSSRRAPATEPVAPSPIGPPAPGGRGWLSDLLNRASRDEGEQPARDFNRDRGREPSRAEPAAERRNGDERSPRHSIESLDSLSVDIARMIDHDAATDLWDRYKRGERNVFTRRLYTLQGQQAFDEIRKKYRADREFKQTVDRYIGEFERLLEEVSRDDRSQVMARTYLTSETGKVYTMLAHAAGRFD
jgi:ABC-type transporter Mla subunit MlaD